VTDRVRMSELVANADATVDVTGIVLPNYTDYVILEVPESFDSGGVVKKCKQVGFYLEAGDGTCGYHVEAFRAQPNGSPVSLGTKTGTVDQTGEWVDYSTFGHTPSIDNIIYVKVKPNTGQLLLVVSGARMVRTVYRIPN